MLKLMKYDFRRHYKPFAVVISIYLLLLILTFFGVNEYKIYDLVYECYTLIQLIFIIYGCREIYKDFCDNDNILGISLPVGNGVRFLSKYITLSILYIIYQCARVIFDLINTESNYNILKRITVNYMDYILYDFIGGILFYMSTVAVVAFALLLVSGLIKNKNIVLFMNVIVIFAAFWTSAIVYQKFIMGDISNVMNGFIYRQGLDLDGAVSIKLRADYMPFSYSNMSFGLHPGWDERIVDRVNIFKYMAKGLTYSITWIIVTLTASVGICKWRGVNR